MNDYLTPHFDRSALLVIDVQRDFVNGAMPVPGTHEVLPRLADLTSAFRADHRPIVHAIRLYQPGGSDVDAVRRATVESGARIVAPGSAGAEIPAPLLPHGQRIPLDANVLLRGMPQQVSEREVVIYKPRWSAFYRTELDTWLRERGVDTVVVAGCNLPNCPRATRFDATERDYRAVVVTDAVSRATPERLADLELLGVNLMTTGDVTTSLTIAKEST